VILSLSVALVSSASNMVFKKIDVEMGPVGSDDDIRLKFCDKSKCCTTKVLSHTFSSEWVKNKKETWDGSDLGNCTQILFDENLSSIELALLKDGKKTGPEVKSITLSAQVGSDKKNIKTYKCGSYKLLASDRIKSNFCQRQSAAKPTSTTARSAAKPTSRPSSPLSSVPSMTFKKIDVQMGGAGSDDDMRVRICDASKCCTTKKLSHTFGSEWVAKKKETWDGSDMGNCSGILFDEKLSAVEVVILKSGKKSSPEITALNVTGQIGSNKKNLQVYLCQNYKFTKNDAQKASFCRSNKTPSPASRSPSVSSSTSSTPSHSISEVVVFIGDDGTNDDVSLEICSEKSSLNCCDTGHLDSSFSDDWSKNDKETWPNKKLGACKTASFDACKGIDVAIKKKSGGKDSLKVSNITVALKKPNEKSTSAMFICPTYSVAASDTVKRNTCTLDRSSSVSCSSSGSRPSSPSRSPSPSRPSSPSRSPTPAPRPSKPSTGPCLRSGTNCGETVSITSFEVELGSDGSSDPVTARICSDTGDVDVCCETPKLSKPGSNNWSRGKETWPTITLGNCNGEKFPTEARTTVTNLNEATLELTLNKKGRDNMQIQEFYINTQNQNGVSRRFKCGRFAVDKERVTKECYAQYPKSSATTRRPGATTTRPPFRSGSG